MQDILTRGQHAAFVATSADDAWRILRDGVLFDLVFIELNVAGSGGINFLRKLREDWFWKILPVVAYTTEKDSRMVRRALALKVQNYLIKPYQEESILSEVAKALQKPWRDLHFDEPASFCALMELTPEALIERRQEVRVGFETAAKEFPRWAQIRENEEGAITRIRDLVASAEGAGVWAGLDYLRDLQIQAIQGNWQAFAHSAEPLTFASQLIRGQLTPGYVPDFLAAALSNPEHAQSVFKF
jgi:CheY-like chemotaxis protein